jgi:hypothetical protein
MKSLVIAAVAAALPMVSANAEIITVEYEATLGAGPLDWPEGVVLAGTLTFDSEAQLTIVGGVATYPLLEHRMKLDSTSFIGHNNRITILNDTLISPSAVYQDGYLFRSSTVGTFNDLDIGEFKLDLHTDTEDEPGGPLTSPALPATEDELGMFDFTKVFVAVRVFGVFVEIPGSLTRLEFLSPPLAAACDGFAAPFDAALGLSKRDQRVIPLRLALLDEDDFPLGPDDITAPTVSVGYASGIGGGVLEQLLLVDSPGRATSGNSFVWDEASQQWAFNLATKPHAAVGTYTVTAVAGDEDYVLSQACSGTFVRH